MFKMDKTGVQKIVKVAKLSQKGTKKLCKRAVEKHLKGAVNWLENDEKARKGVTKIEKSKQGANGV